MPRRSLILVLALLATVAIRAAARTPGPWSMDPLVVHGTLAVADRDSVSLPVISGGSVDSTGIHWFGAAELATARDSFVVKAARKRFQLSRTQIGDSERVWLDGRRLTRWSEYRLDRVRGILWLEHPPPDGAELVVEYPFATVATPPRVQLHPLTRPHQPKEFPSEPAQLQERGPGWRGAGEEVAGEAEGENLGLQVRGSKSISVQGGTNREATVDQGLHLQVTGRITENTFVKAEISDENLPITPEGNTEELRDIDQVRIELFGPRGRAVLGDFQLSQPLGVFVPYQRKLQGLWLHGRDPKAVGTVLAGSPRGERREVEFRGREGVQGPYELINGLRDDQSFIVAGTERVWVDGVPQVRGENNQYTIDYVRGTITFTELRPVGPENRIAVDFEVSSAGYTRTVVGAMADSLRLGSVRLHASWIKEADDASRPLAGPLSAEDEEVLRQAGDDPDRALGSGITRVPPGEEGSGEYVRKDSLGVEIFVYAPTDSMANYFLNFERVGEGQGDYRQVDVDRKGERIFEYVGEGNGDHRIGRRLALPSSTQALVAGIQVGSNLTDTDGFFRAEADFTRRDENILSPKDDDNNDGMAWRVEGASPWLFSRGEATGLRVKASAEGIDPRFFELGRIRAPFYYEAWNLQDKKRSQWEGVETLEILARDAARSSKLGVKRLHRHGGYNGRRARWSAAGPLLGPFQWKHDLAFTSHDNGENGSKGNRRDRTATLGLDLGSAQPYVRWVDEHFADGPTKDKTGYRSEEWTVGLASSNAIADGRIEYRRRLADSLSTDGTQWRFEQDLREWRAQAEGLHGAIRWNLDGTWRESRLPGDLDESTRLGRIALGWRPLNSMIGADIDYRAGNDRSRVIERKIIFVGERQGDYDQEGNRLGRNLGDYNVIFTAGDSLVSAIDVKLNSKFDAQWPSAPVVGGLSFNGQFSVEERSQSDDLRGVLTLDPKILRNAETTIFGQQHTRADLTLLRSHRRTDLRLTFDETQMLDRRFSKGAETSYRRERVVRIDRDLSRGWSLRLDGGDRARERHGGQSTSLASNEYQVDDLFAGVELGYRPTARTRGKIEGRAQSRTDVFSGVSQRVWELSPGLTTDLLRGRWTAEFRWAKVAERAGDPLLRPYFFERPGSNRRLSVVAQWAVGKVLSVTIRYQLRSEPQRKTLHDLSVETRARF